MPFNNMTNDTIWNVWQGCIQNELISSLTNLNELKLRQIESINSLLKSNKEINTASLTPSIASTISQKLDAKIFIYGSIKKDRDILRINAQLIDSKTKESLKSFQIDGASEKKILPIIDSLSSMVKNFLIITALKKEIPQYFHRIISTNSSVAYRYYMYGHHAFYKEDYPTARDWLIKAIDIDTNFVGAMVMLSFAYGNPGMTEEAKKWSLKAYRKRGMTAIQLNIFIEFVYSENFETPNEAIKHLKELLELDDQSPMTYRNIGSNYIKLYLYDKAIPEYEKSLEIYNKWGSKPDWVLNYTRLGMAYHKTGHYKKEKDLYRIAEKDFPDNLSLIYRQAVLALSEKDSVSAKRYIENYISGLKESSKSEKDITTSLAEIYSEAEVIDKAEKYYIEAFQSEPGNPLMINNLTYFLIDKDRNVDQGLDLLNKALESDPENYSYLHSKGWGLYKQGKYREAYEILQTSWDLRKEKAVYDHSAFLHLEAAKKAIDNLK
jgi:tetratricopeptide (TPR) repeat protein